MVNKYWKQIVLVLIGLLALWFIFFKSVKITITYNGIESQVYNSYIAVPETASARVYNGNAKSAAMKLDMVANYAGGATYDAEEAVEESGVERYDISHNYTIHSTKFDELCDNISNIVKERKAIIKTDDLNSTTLRYYDNEYSPRYKYYSFQIDSKIAFLDDFEKILKKYGEIRSNNDEVKSVEAKISDINDRLANLKELLADAEKSKSTVYKDEEKIKYDKLIADYKREIANYEKDLKDIESKTTYITYDLYIYEKIEAQVNALKYWYENNYEVKTAVKKIIPLCVYILAIGFPSVLLILIFVAIISKILNNKENFEKKIKIVKENFGDNVKFDIKM